MTDASQLDVVALLTEVGVDASAADPAESVGNTTIIKSAEVDSEELPVYGRGAAAGPTQITFESVVAEDAYSIFYQARQNSMRRRIVARTVHPEKQVQNAAGRILREGWMLGALEHPNILPVYGVGKDESGNPVVLMKSDDTEAWDGILADPLHPRGTASDGDVTDRRVRRVVEACKAAEFAHAIGVVHRDIKPSNIRIGATGAVYLHGWNLAVSLVNDGTSRFPLVQEQKQVAGTPAYMAPELATKNTDAIGPKTDVYLLGATLHHALTGRPRHLGENVFDAFYSAASSTPVDYGDEVPEALAAILNRAMAREPSDRYASAEDLRVALEQFLSHRPAARLLAHAAKAHEEFERALVRGARDYFVRELFATAYTAYSETLQFDRSNASATDGLTQILCEMVEYEVENGSLSRARDLLSRLEAPPRRLELQVERALHLRSEAQLSGTLESPAIAAAYEQGRAARTWFMIAMVTIWSGFGLAFGLVETFGWFEITTLALQAAAALCWVTLGGIAALLGPPLLSALTSRLVVGPGLVIVLGSVVLQVQAMTTGLGPQQLVVNHFLLFFICMAVLNAIFDWRLLPGTVAYLGAYLLGLFFPELAYWSMALSNLIGLGFVGYVIQLRLNEGVEP